jgi:hypothetical protein
MIILYWEMLLKHPCECLIKDSVKKRNMKNKVEIIQSKIFFKSKN